MKLLALLAVLVTAQAQGPLPDLEPRPQSLGDGDLAPLSWNHDWNHGHHNWNHGHNYHGSHFHHPDHLHEHDNHHQHHQHRHSDCCVSKQVGDKTYHLVDGFCQKAKLWGCNAECCYTRDGYNGDDWFCFKSDPKGQAVKDCEKDYSPESHSNEHHHHHHHHSESSSSESASFEGIFSVYVNARENFTLFADGVRILRGNDWRQTYWKRLNAIPKLLAIKTEGDTEGEKGIHLRTNTGVVTDSSWKCEDHKHQDWNSAPKDDEFPRNAAEIDPDWASSEEIHNLADNAKWIWYEKQDAKEVFCIKRL